jgi:hypothetical protein
MMYDSSYQRGFCISEGEEAYNETNLPVYKISAAFERLNETA